MNIQHKKPSRDIWEYRGTVNFTLNQDAHVYDHPLGIRVLSAVEPTKRGPEWHLSITANFGKYPNQGAIDLVRKDFAAEKFEHDDHSKKIASLWLPVNRDMEGECECKT